MAMLNNQTVCIMYMSIVLVTKKMQLSEILLEYVKTKCDDLNLFVGIAIVQIYTYIYIISLSSPRGHDRLVLWRFAGGRGQPVSLRACLHGHDVHDARAAGAGGFFGCHRCSAVETTWRPFRKVNLDEPWKSAASGDHFLADWWWLEPWNFMTFHIFWIVIPTD